MSFTTDSYSRFYYGTDTRMFELLVGVGLALSWYFWVIPVSPRSVWLRGALNVGGFVAIAAILVTACVFRNGGRSYQHGGALVVAVASAVLIFACLDSRRPVARMLSIAPLAWIGKVSYGAYLYHWPIYALSGTHWGPLRGIWLSFAQLALSLALAGLSFRYLEAPILRRRRVQGTKRLAVSWGSAAAMVAVAALVVSAVQPARTSTGLASAESAVSSSVRVEPKVTLPRTVEVDRPLRILITGDSTAEAMAIALVNFQNEHPQQIQVLNLSQSGCPFTTSLEIRYYSGDPGRDVHQCSSTWRASVPTQVRAFQPDVSLVFLSLVEQADQLDPAGAAWHNVLEPGWRVTQEQAFQGLVSDLEVTGAPVAWTDAPYCKFQQDLPWFGDDPARTDALNTIYRDMAGKEPKFTLLPYAGQLNRPNHFVDTSLRPDGVHLGIGPARALLERWLLPLLDRYRPRALVPPSPSPLPTISPSIPLPPTPSR